MAENTQEFNKVKSNKIIYPVLIGLGVATYMLWTSFQKPGTMEAFELVQFTWNTLFWLIVALFLMVIRDIGYMIRLRVLTDKDFSWQQVFRIIMLWEFTSAVTPSAIGGTGLAVIYLNKEGLNVGRSTAVVMATSFLDELYFIIMFPLMFFIVGFDKLFALGGDIAYVQEFMWVAITGYSVKFVYTVILTYGLFQNPKGLKWLIMRVFRIKILRKWFKSAYKATDDIVTSSIELRKKSAKFWLKAFFATFFSWTSRYWVVNALFLAFFSLNEHFLLFARQLVMWIMMLVSPTPGGSGFSEFVFSNYLGDFLPAAGIAVVMAILWRLVTYYPYLFIGAIILPKWIKEKIVKT